MIYDIQLVNIYKGKLADSDIASYHTRLTWISQRDAKAREVAKDMFDKKIKLIQCKGTTPSSANILKELEEYEKHIARTHDGPSTEVKAVVLMNWVAPSLFHLYSKRCSHNWPAFS